MFGGCFFWQFRARDNRDWYLPGLLFAPDQSGAANAGLIIFFSTANGPDSEYSALEIKTKIAELENEYRIPFEMHTEGFKYKEIAENLDLSIGTVKSRIFFSRKKLMKKLSDYKQ